MLPKATFVSLPNSSCYLTCFFDLAWKSLVITVRNWLPGSIKTNLDFDLTETFRTSVFDQEIYTDKLKNQIKVFASDGILRINIFT